VIVPPETAVDWVMLLTEVVVKTAKLGHAVVVIVAGQSAIWRFAPLFTETCAPLVV
jgi:hypothetical protein